MNHHPASPEYKEIAKLYFKINEEFFKNVRQVNPSFTKFENYEIFAYTFVCGLKDKLSKKEITPEQFIDLVHMVIYA